MRRADRLFEIIQILRAAKGPVKADDLARQLEVTPRTVYRDMVTLQARSVPIEGAAGIGYIMRPGYDLPPLMFTLEEVDAISVGLSMLGRTADDSIRTAAATAIEKIRMVLPGDLDGVFQSETNRVSQWSIPQITGVDVAMVRKAIRGERKLAIGYRDDAGQETERTIRPIALIYYSDVIVVTAWCELRDDFRNFRADRFLRCGETGETFTGEGDALRQRWQELETAKA